MEGVTQAHGTLLKDTSLQFGFPAPPSLPPKVDPLAVPEVPFSLGDGSGVFWVVVVVVAVGLLWLIVSRVRGELGPRAAAPEASAVLVPAGVPVPRAALDEADVLAAAGRYGEAVHALLLRGVGAIRARYPRALAPAHTSRDIAGLPVLPEAMRQAFAGIAQRTERAVFAQRDLVREDWEACRTLYAGLLA